MNRMRNLLLLTLFMSVLPMATRAQEEMTVYEEIDSTYTAISEHLLLFQEDLVQLHALSRFRVDVDIDMPLTEPLLDVVGERMRTLTRAMNSFNARWDAYSQAQQVYIADNDSLLNKLAEIQQMRQIVADTLASRQKQYDQLTAFSKAESFVWGQDKAYRRLYKQAQQYSVSPKLASRLEKVKAEEQALFAQIQTSYGQAKEAAEAFPGLELRMKGIDNKFFELQTVSDQDGQAGS